MRVTELVNGILLAWLAIEVVRLWQDRVKSGQVRDRGSFGFIGATVGVTFLAGNLVAGLAGRQWELGPWAPNLGLVFLVLGIAFRQYAIAVLGRYFTVRVTIQEGHTLVRRGPYRWLRHPSYTGAWVALAAAGLVTRSLPGFLVFATLPLVGFLRRIRVEERALVDAFGSEYTAYAARTWRLIPFIY